MKDVLFFIWELPQNILGFLVSLFGKKKTVTTYTGDNVKVWFKPLFNSGVSLGRFIILDTLYLKTANSVLTRSVSHEHGHQVQSRIFGWFYLPVVGLVSISRNIWDRIAHKDWLLSKRQKWYYGGFPEKQADEFGGVERRWV